MDDDVIHATKAFLEEFDGAASDDDTERRRLLGQPTVHTQVPPKTPLNMSRRQNQATTRPVKKARGKGPAKPKTTKAMDDSTLKAETASTTSSAASETVPLAQPKTRKEELQFLRDQVMELEEKLRLLKRGVGNDDPPTTTAVVPHGGRSNALIPVDSVPKPKRIASMWEDLAMRQYQQRQRAEVENLKLKSSLEDQLKVAKSLQRMLKRSKCDALTSQNHAKRGRRVMKKSSTEDAAEFHELSSTVIDMYERIGDAFADARFATADVDFRDVNVQQDEATGTTIEVLIAKMVPFDVKTTATAMWEYFINESLGSHGLHVERTEELTTDSVMKSIRVELEIKKYCGRFRGKIVGKRYHEVDRVIIVWAVLAEPVEVSDAPMDGIILRQRGWTMIRKPSTSELANETNVAMIHTKHVAIPMVYEDDVPDHKRKLELLTNYIVFSLFHQIEAGQQVLENLLFESLKTTMSNQQQETAQDSNER